MVMPASLQGNGVFSGRWSGFASFLSTTGQDSSLGSDRFAARNFLLDEWVSDERALSYHSSRGTSNHSSIKEWNRVHNEYLESTVFLDQPNSGAPQYVDLGAFDACPETFRHPDDLTMMGDLEPSLELLRVERAQSIAGAADVRLTDLMHWAHVASLNPRRETSEAKVLDVALKRWASTRDLRPVFVGFWEDLHEVFGADPEHDPLGWEDNLRDRLGLSHYDPGVTARPIPILVFKYDVRSIPHYRTRERTRAVAVPSVLDGRISSAFCPAPRGLSFGRVVDLSASLYVLGREAVHAFLPPDVRQLFRVGEVRGPVSLDLSRARLWHLEYLRDEMGRADYALGTDGDLV